MTANAGWRRALGSVRGKLRRQPGPGVGELLHTLDRELAAWEAPRVAVVEKPGESLLADHLAAATPAARLVRFVPGSSLTTQLVAAGPFDVAVDGSAAPVGVTRRFAALLFALEPGGVLVMRDVASSPGPSALRERVDQVADLRAAGKGAQPESELGVKTRANLAARDLASLAFALDRLEITDSHFVATTRVRALTKIREEQADTLLELDPSRGAVLGTVAAGRSSAAGAARSNSGSRLASLPSSYDAPVLTLREHHDVICLPGQVVLQDNAVLSATYRHIARRRLKNKFLAEWSPAHVVPPALDREPVQLAGRWFHLDNEHRGHFGHVMTEQISMLWAWEQAKAADPDLKALVMRNRRRSLATWEYELLAAGGVAPEDVVEVDGPVRVPTLVTGTPMYSMPQYVHPRIRETWSRIGSHLVAAAPDPPAGGYPDRIFCSRRVSKRACRNTPEVESFFAERGFEVIYPEDYPLGHQVRLFREASVVAGFSGSGMFQLEFVDTPTEVILVTSESYTAQNEHMIAAVLGHRVTVAVCDADVPLPEHGWTRLAFESTFTFDLAREGAWLSGVIDGL